MCRELPITNYMYYKLETATKVHLAKTNKKSTPVNAHRVRWLNADNLDLKWMKEVWLITKSFHFKNKETPKKHSSWIALYEKRKQNKHFDTLTRPKLNIWKCEHIRGRVRETDHKYLRLHERAFHAAIHSLIMARHTTASALKPILQITLLEQQGSYKNWKRTLRCGDRADTTNLSKFCSCGVVCANLLHHMSI